MALSASRPSSLFPESGLHIPPDTSTVTDFWHMGGCLILSSFFLLNKGQRDVPTYTCRRIRGRCSYRPERGII